VEVRISRVPARTDNTKAPPHWLRNSHA
jgi:hypothetical protein